MEIIWSFELLAAKTVETLGRGRRDMVQSKRIDLIFVFNSCSMAIHQVKLYQSKSSWLPKALSQN